MSLWTVVLGIAAWKLLVPLAIVSLVVLAVGAFLAYVFACDSVAWVRRKLRHRKGGR